MSFLPREPFPYFSACTITAADFGNITAIHSLAGSPVMRESVIGILVALPIDRSRDISGRRQ